MIKALIGRFLRSCLDAEIQRKEPIDPDLLNGLQDDLAAVIEGSPAPTVFKMIGDAAEFPGDEREDALSRYKRSMRKISRHLAVSRRFSEILKRC